MSITIIGKHPAAPDADGNLPSGVATLFLTEPAWVAVPGVHAMQAIAYVAHRNRERQARGEPPLTEFEELALIEDSVDLFLDRGSILIRPDPARMDRAFAADEILQGFVSKRQIRFLDATNETVRQAIKERGELWRIAPLPLSADEQKQMIERARTGIGHGAIYYQNRVSGTRYLTLDAFRHLARMEPGALARQLQEIAEFSARTNARGNPEVAFFAASHGLFTKGP